MDPLVLERSPVEQSGGKSLMPTLHSVLLGLFLIQFCLVCCSLWLPIFGRARPQWPGLLLLVLAAVTTGASLARRLPLQNVLLASILIVFISAAAQALGVLGEHRMDPYHPRDAPQTHLIWPVRWLGPVFWVLVVLNSQGVARLISHPLRRLPTYGLWVLGLTTMLVVLDFNLWSPGIGLAVSPIRAASVHSWQFTAFAGVLVEAMIALFTTIAITPVLISKKPGPQPADFHPLLTWALLSILAFLS